jgi:hypothetical protein
MKAEVLPVNDVRITPQWMYYIETFIGSDGNKFATHQEKSIEKSIIKILDEIGIHASVKSDRYSLPVHGSVISSVGQSSYINDIFESKNVKRKFIKTILDSGCKKVRFYVYVYTTEVDSKSDMYSMFLKKYNIEIRYFIHN